MIVYQPAATSQRKRNGVIMYHRLSYFQGKREKFSAKSRQFPAFFQKTPPLSAEKT